MDNVTIQQGEQHFIPGRLRWCKVRMRETFSTASKESELTIHVVSIVWKANAALLTMVLPCPPASTTALVD